MQEKPALKIVYRQVADLIPYARNARTHSDEQVTRIASSIKEFGFTNPILIDGDNGILCGHGRLAAAKKLGMREVPTIELSGMTDAQKRAYILADNKLALDAGWDEELLRLEFEELRGGVVDLSLTGFTKDEIDALFEDSIEDEENPYTQKTDIPQYEIQGLNPTLAKCFNDSKTKDLIREIEDSTVSEDEKTFLIEAAHRHSSFNYKNIAEYYANASKEMQELMERSALVIIDYDNAIRNGFTRLSQSLEKAKKE